MAAFVRRTVLMLASATWILACLTLYSSSIFFLQRAHVTVLLVHCRQNYTSSNRTNLQPSTPKYVWLCEWKWHKLAVIFLFITDGKKSVASPFSIWGRDWRAWIPAERGPLQILQRERWQIFYQRLALSVLHMNHFFTASKGQKQRLSFPPFSFPLLLTCLSPCPYPMWLHICST